MLEMDVVQVRGFRNLVEDGEVTGFQFRVRSTYYRGMWLSLLRPGTVIVDGEEFGEDQITWEIGGIDYTIAQMKEIDDVQWPNSEAAVIKVRKQGGLSSGYHDVSIAYRYIMSYVPPIASSDESFAMMPEQRFSRTMILI